jgi:hypothetical protein
MNNQKALFDCYFVDLLVNFRSTHGLHMWTNGDYICRPQTGLLMGCVSIYTPISGPCDHEK